MQLLAEKRRENSFCNFVGVTVNTILCSPYRRSVTSYVEVISVSPVIYVSST